MSCFWRCGQNRKGALNGGSAHLLSSIFDLVLPGAAQQFGQVRPANNAFGMACDSPHDNDAVGGTVAMFGVRQRFALPACGRAWTMFEM